MLGPSRENPMTTATKSTAPYYAPGEGSECIAPVEVPEGETQAVKEVPKTAEKPVLTTGKVVDDKKVVPPHKK